MKQIKIAIDGPASSGKSTTAKLVAKRLNYQYIDTGAMYRVVTLAWLETGKELTEEIMSDVINNNNFKFEFNPDNPIVYLNEKNVSTDIRSNEVTTNVSPVSAVKIVREKLVAMQREMSKDEGTVLDGRDIGTVVFPDAELKIYLIASIDSRAKRRYLEIKNSGADADLEEIRNMLKARDAYDSSREISPLRKAEDAFELDTSELTIDGQVQIVYDKAIKIINS